MLSVFASLHHDGRLAREPVELTLRRRDGVALRAEVFLEPHVGPGEARVLVLLREMTRDARDVERVDWLEGVARASSDAIVSVDAAGVVRAMNPAAEALYGPDATSAIGHLLGHGLSPEQQEQALRVFEHVRAGEQAAVTQRRYDLPCGDTIWLETAVTAARAADGTFLGATFISRDVTAEVRSRHEVAEQLERLRALGRRGDATGVADAADGAPAPVPSAAAGRVLARALPHVSLDVVWATRLHDGRPMIDAIVGDPEVLGPAAVAGHLPDPSTSLCLTMLRGEAPSMVGDLRTAPGMARVCEAVPNVRAYVGAPVILEDGTVYGAVGAASRTAREVDESDRRILALLADVVADAVDEARSQVVAAQAVRERATVDSLVAALDARDQYTAEHSAAVVELSGRLAEAAGLSPSACEEVRLVARLHDIGKVGIPDAILRKPGRLEPPEWDLMREHPAIGERIVRHVGSLAHLAPAIRAEHERWDGTGYPDGLAGEDIPIASRVVLVCDAWHAMISDRPYRARLPAADAMAELRRCAGTQFDPDLAAALVRLLEHDGVVDADAAGA